MSHAARAVVKDIRPPLRSGFRLKLVSRVSLHVQKGESSLSNSVRERVESEMSLKGLSRWAALASCAAVLLAACAGAVRAQGGWSGGRQGLQGKDLNAVYFLDSKRGWVAGDGGVVLRTRDGGHTWTRQTVETKESFNDIYFRNEEDG